MVVWWYWCKIGALSTLGLLTVELVEKSRKWIFPMFLRQVIILFFLQFRWDKGLNWFEHELHPIIYVTGSRPNRWCSSGLGIANISEQVWVWVRPRGARTGAEPNPGNFSTECKAASSLNVYHSASKNSCEDTDGLEFLQWSRYHSFQILNSSFEWANIQWSSMHQRPPWKLV